MLHQINIEYANKLIQVYELKCKPICKELNLTQTSFDILMFLYNNPQYKMAKDIVKIRGIRANLVSMNVDKLVNDGLLIRKNISNDRRKTELILTKKSKDITTKGVKIQKEFFHSLLENVSSEKKDVFYQTINQIKENLNNMMRGEK